MTMTMTKTTTMVWLFRRSGIFFFFWIVWSWHFCPSIRHCSSLVALSILSFTAPSCLSLPFTSNNFFCNLQVRVDVIIFKKLYNLYTSWVFSREKKWDAKKKRKKKRGHGGPCPMNLFMGFAYEIWSLQYNDVCFSLRLKDNIMEFPRYVLPFFI